MTSKDLENKIDEQTTVEQSSPESTNNETTTSVNAKGVDKATESSSLEDKDGTASSVTVIANEDSAGLFEAALAELEDPEYNRSDVSYSPFSKGEKIEATIIQVDKEKVFVDLGMKSEGILPLSELTDGNIEEAAKELSSGDKIHVIVLKPGSGERSTIVSKKRADFTNAWQSVVEAHQNGTVITAPVIDRVKGGLIADVGVKGFIPTSHVGGGNLRNVDKFVGQLLPFKVIEIDKERKKVVLSNKLAEDESREAAQKKAFETLNVGDIIPGTVRRLTEYGAFIDIGGVDGLLHISEISWARIGHPKEVLKENEEIQVMVLKLDSNIGKISLGLRQVLPDPWNTIREHYRIGDKLTGKIHRLSPNGAFILLPEGAEAFLPISEISNERIAKIEDSLKVNEDVETVIIDLQTNLRRMLLSIRQANSSTAITSGSEALEQFEQSVSKGAPKKKRKKRSDRDDNSSSNHSSSGGTTIGERLGQLKALLSNDN